MRVLVTGATGFVGYHAARALAARGHEVRVLARSLEKAERLFRSARDVEIAVGDMTDEVAVDAALSGMDAVLHAAATVSFSRDAADALRDANLAGVRNVLGGASERGLGAILYVSSLTTLFDPRGPDPTEDSPVARQRNPYARAKAAAEREARELAAAGAPLATVYPNARDRPRRPGLERVGRRAARLHVPLPRERRAAWASWTCATSPRSSSRCSRRRRPGASWWAASSARGTRSPRRSRPCSAGRCAA